MDKCLYKRHLSALKSLRLKSLSIGLLTIATAVLIPSTAQAANFLFGDKAVIGLFRGAGGLLGSSISNSGVSGIDTLAREINNAFPDYALTTQVFDSYEGNIFNFQEVGSDRGTAFLNSLSNVGAIGLVGYSAGGLSAIRTAKSQSPKPINLLVQIESYEPLTGRNNEDEILPGNVQAGINYYQSRNRFNVFGPGWDPSDLQGATNVSGSQNINVEDLLGDRSITHRTIINDSRVQNLVVQDIQEKILKDLTFDRAGQLKLDSGADFTQNILRLTPGRDSQTADVRLSESIPSDSSFQSRIEFRLPFERISDGLSFWIGPNDQPEGDNQLTLKFDPLLPSESIHSNRLLLLTPGQGSDSENSPFALNGRDPITAWVDYDSDSKQYQVFLSNTVAKPSESIFSRTIDLSALGADIYFGFRAAGDNDGQYADLLSWNLQTTNTADKSIESDAAQLAFLALTKSGTEQTDWVADLGLANKNSSESVPEPRLLFALGLVSGGLWLTRRKGSVEINKRR